MKKVIIVILVLIATGFVIGGGLAYWHIGKQNSASAKANLENQTEQEEVNSQQKLTEEYHSIDEYKEKFSKDAKYIKICTGDGAIDYSMFDVNDINAANQAVACYQMKYDQKRGTKEAEDDYITFTNFYWKFIDSHNKDIIDAGETIRINDKSRITNVKIIVDILAKRYYKYGINVEYGELEFVGVKSNLYVYEHISPYLSDNWIAYLDLLIMFDSQIRNIDGYFVISKCELERIINNLNAYNKEYSEFSKERGVPDSIKYYEKALITYPKVPD